MLAVIDYISLPSDYSGDNQKTRMAFVSYYNSTSITYNDVYLIDESLSQQPQRLNVNGGAPIDLSSIAYFGTHISGKLLAGFVEPSALNVAQVKWTVNPLGTPLGTPNSTVWYIANQPPSGPGNAQVAWSYSGAVGFCGTGANPGSLYDESAFSQSLDNGNNWQQTSLMNTKIHMTDIAPAPDSPACSWLPIATSARKAYGAAPESRWASTGAGC